MKKFLSFLFAGLAIAVRAESGVVQEVFTRHLEEIVVSNQCRTVEGFVFLTVRIESNDNSFRMEILPYKTADLLTRICMERNREKRDVSFEVERLLTRSYWMIVKCGELLDPYRVTSNRLTDGSVCVWGMPESEWEAFLPSWKKIRDTLCSPSRFSDRYFHPCAVMEIAPPELQLSLRKVYVDMLQVSFGQACSLLCSGGVLVSYSPEMDASLSDDFLRDAGVRTLFQTLNVIPGNPRVIAALARRFDGRGMRTAAQWIASRGGLSFLGKAASCDCAEIVAKGSLFTLYEYSCEVDVSVYQSMLDKADFSQTPVEIFSLWKRPFPGGNSEKQDPLDRDYAEGKLLCETGGAPRDAYLLFLKSVAREISFDACVQAGICAFEMEKYNEAVFLFLQAAETMPVDRRDLPWAYLVRIAGRLNAKEAFAYGVSRLKECRRIRPEFRETLKEECGLSLSAQGEKQ